MKQQHDEQQPTTQDRDETRSRTPSGVSSGSVGHTPGPWLARRLIDGATGQPYATMYQAHIDLGVCMIWCPPGHARQEANTRLIAAAPDLLEALREALPDLHGHWLLKARAAIAKATGSAP